MNTARLLVPLAAVALAVDIGIVRLGYGLTLPAMKAELPGSFGLYGVIATLHLGSYLGGSMLAPLVLRRLSWRAVFVLAHVLVALGLLAQAHVASVEMLASVRAFLGLVTGLGVLSALGAALESAEPQRRMMASAVIWTGVALGMVLSAPVGSWTLEQVGRWRIFSMVCAVLALIFALLGRLVAFPTNTSAQIATPKVRAIDGLRQLRDSIFLLWAYAFYGFAYFIYATFALTRLVAGLASGKGTTVVWLWITFGATAAIGSLALPLIMRGRLRTHAMIATVGIGALGALASLGSGNGFAIVSAMFVGLGLTSAPAVASAYARERVDVYMGPRSLALATIACAAGQMTGPVLTGVVIDVFGIESMTVLLLVGYALATVFAKLDQLHQMRIRQSS